MKKEDFEAVLDMTVLKLVLTAGGDKKSRLSRRERSSFVQLKLVDRRCHTEYKGP